MNAANDYATSAAKELTIREQTAGLVGSPCLRNCEL